MTTSAADAPPVWVPRKLSPIEKAKLVGEVVAAYVRARRALAASNLPTALGQLRASAPSYDNGSQDPRDVVEGMRLGRVVTRILTPLPVESRCLMRSLVLTNLLARRGIESRLVIGVKRGDKFGAHAWIELYDKPVLPTGSDTFERLVEL